MHPQGSTGVPPAWPPPPGPPPRPKWSWSGLLGVGIGTVALVVAIVAVARPSASSLTHVAPPSAASSTVTSTAAKDSVAEARALCTVLAPLFGEMDQKSNAWQATGDPGTPARDAALPGYRAFVEDWAGRAQDALAAHPDADSFLKRTLQRFIDDRILMVRNMRPGPATEYDKEAWADSGTAYEGPLSVCYQLGIKW